MKKKEEKIPLKSLAGLMVYPILLVAITFAVYSNILHGDFVYDDRYEILDNSVIRSTDNLGVAFKKPFLAFYRSDQDVANYYRPLKTVFYILMIRIWGTDSFHFHFVSITLHALVGIIFFFLANSFIKDRRYAALAALIFIVHPAQSEAVAWISSSFNDPPFSLLYLIAFSSYLYREKFPGTGLGLSVSALFFFVALLAKETAFSFIPLIAATQIFFRSPTRWKERILHLGFFFTALAAYLIMRFNALSSISPTSKHALSVFQILISAAYFFAKYLALFLFPAGLNTYHRVYPLEHLLDWRFLLSLPVLFAYVSVAVILWKNRSPFFFYMAWIPLTLFPMFYFKAMAFSFFCERYLYLPMLGYALVLSHGMKLLSERFKNRAASALPYFALVFIIANYSILTVKRNHVWINNLTFFSDTFKNYPESRIIDAEYCSSLLKLNRASQSLGCFENYSRKNPGDMAINVQLGNVYAEQANQMLANGNLDDAEKFFDLADDKLSRVSFNTRADADIYYNLAFIQLGKAKIYKSRNDFSHAEQATSAAIQYLEKCIKANPEDYWGYYVLGDLLLAQAQQKRQAANQARQNGQTGDADKLAAENRELADAALAELEKAIRLAPSYTQVLNSLGAAYKETGQCQIADETFQKALRIEGNNDSVLFNLGLNYLECSKKPAQARETFIKLLSIKPNDPRALLYLKRIDSGMSPR